MSPTTFALFWAVALPAIAWAGWGAVSAWTGLALVAAGLGLWTLFEYAMHRYLFHLRSDFPPVRAMIFLMHGNHHDDPGDPLRGLMPLPASLPIAGLVWLALYLAAGTPGTWIFLGFMTGYVLYDVVHFACHQWDMSGPVGTMLKRHHMRHHFVDHDRNFAITAIWWDWVFGSQITTLRQSSPGRGQTRSRKAKS
ncbi:sterol desaturase family protein [Croceibacterium ferulae]|uniref:sterol desaturase family protein n=1 Tax=Croceibacterium ferulae TaxID=1854641 RepID=UPI001F4EA040|nr:sterol desaturase family protein [Croceibacterium ferulae]